MEGLATIEPTMTTVDLKHIYQTHYRVQGLGLPWFSDKQTNKTLLGVGRQSRDCACGRVASGTAGLTLHHTRYWKPGGWTYTDQDWPLYQSRIS